MKMNLLIASLVGVAGFAHAEPSALDETVLVKWKDGLSLTRSDYDAVLLGIPESDRFAFQASERRIGQLLNNMLLTRTLADEARKIGLDKDPLLQKEMAYAAERVLASRRLDVLEKELKIPDMTAAAEERYRLKPEEFRLAESVSASHVLVDTKQRSEAEALERAEQVRAKALSGIPFPDLAREYSDDPSAQGNQGNLGFFTRGRMAKPFEDAAFGLEKPGDISAVVKTQFGYHVIRLNEKQTARQRTFDEVKEGLIGQLTRSYIEKEKQRHAELITTDKSIVMNLEAISTLKKEMPKLTPPTGAAAAEK